MPAFVVAEVAAIGFIAVVAFVAMLRGAGYYARERRSLAHLADYAGREFASAEDFVLAASAEADHLPPDSLVYERLAAVQKLCLARCPVPVAELSELSVERAELGWHHRLPRFALVGLIVLGVGTTFSNLAHTLSQARLGDVVVNDQFSDRLYQEAIRSITQGFGAAFSASIAAIFGTVALLLVQALFTGPAKDRFFNELDSFTQTELIPLFLRSQGRSTQEELVYLVVQKLEGTVTDFQRLANGLHDSIRRTDDATGRMATFGEGLGRVVDGFAASIGQNSKFHETLERLFLSVNASEKRHRDLLDQFGRQATVADQQNLALGRTQELLAKFQEVVSASQKSFLTTVEGFVREGQERVTSQQREVLAQSRPLLEAVEKALRQTGTLTTGLQESTGALQTVLRESRNQQSEESAAARTTLAGLTRSIGTLEGKIGEFQAPSLDVLAKLEKLGALDDIGPALEGAVAHLTEVTQGTFNSLQLHFDTYDNRVIAAASVAMGQAEILQRWLPLLEEISASLVRNGAPAGHAPGVVPPRRTSGRGHRPETSEA